MNLLWTAASWTTTLQSLAHLKRLWSLQLPWKSALSAYPASDEASKGLTIISLYNSDPSLFVTMWNSNVLALSTVLDFGKRHLGMLLNYFCVWLLSFKFVIFPSKQIRFLARPWWRLMPISQLQFLSELQIFSSPLYLLQLFLALLLEWLATADLVAPPWLTNASIFQDEK